MTVGVGGNSRRRRDLQALLAVLIQDEHARSGTAHDPEIGRRMLVPPYAHMVGGRQLVGELGPVRHSRNFPVERINRQAGAQIGHGHLNSAW